MSIGMEIFGWFVFAFNLFASGLNLIVYVTNRGGIRNLWCFLVSYLVAVLVLTRLI